MLLVPGSIHHCLGPWYPSRTLWYKGRWGIPITQREMGLSICTGYGDNTRGDGTGYMYGIDVIRRDRTGYMYEYGDDAHNIIYTVTGMMLVQE